MPQVSRQTPQVVVSERSRRLPTKTFLASSIVSLDLNRDSVYKSLSVTLSGSVQVTYTGTYTAQPVASFDALVPRMEIVVNGSRTVKSVRPWLASTKILFATGQQPERKSSAAAAALTPANPTADGGFAVPTSTQFSTIRETIDIFFMDIMAKTGPSQNFTMLNLAGATSAVLNFTCGAASSLDAANNAATSISYVVALSLDVVTREAQDQVNNKFSDLKETTKSVLFNGQQTEFAVDINRGNFVRGIWLMCRNGDAAKSLSNDAIQQISFKANGFLPLKEYQSMAKIQAVNRAQYGLSVPYASNASRLDGVAYIDLLKDGDPGTALDARFLDNLQLFITTAASGSGATYTNNVELTIQTDEYVMPA